MAQIVSNQARKEMLENGIGTILKAALYNGGTLDVDDGFMADVDGTELSTTGYAPGFSGTGRVQLTGVVFARDDAGDLGNVTSDGILFAAIGGTVPFTKLVIYKPVTSDADSPVIAQYDFSGTTDGGDVTATIDAAGLIEVA